MSYLREQVLVHGADLGIAHDGDADRCLAVDAAGELVDGDQILAVCAIALHEAGRLVNDTVVATVMSNLGFHHAMRAAGVKVITTAVGDRYVLEALNEHSLSLGGEQSGHVIFTDAATTGDGMLTALRLMGRMATSGRSLAELAQIVHRLPQVLINVAVTDRAAVSLSETVAEAIDRCGVRTRRRRPDPAAAVGHRAAGAGHGGGADPRPGRCRGPTSGLGRRSTVDCRPPAAWPCPGRSFISPTENTPSASVLTTGTDFAAPRYRVILMFVRISEGRRAAVEPAWSAVVRLRDPLLGRVLPAVYGPGGDAPCPLTSPTRIWSAACATATPRRSVICTPITAPPPIAPRDGSSAIRTWPRMWSPSPSRACSRRLQGGNGPTGDLFPYLLVTMRNVAASWGRESVKWTPVGDDTAFQPRDARDSVAGADELPVDRLNMSLTSSAFETLPRRWRTVLWYLEVEGESATDVGQRLGLSDVAVRQLARRAREGLREAYLAAYLGGEPAIGDHVPSADLVSMARGKLSLRRRALVEKHLDTCPRCSGLLFQAAEENSTLRALALPFYLAAAFALVRWWHAAGSLVPEVPRPRCAEHSGRSGRRCRRRHRRGRVGVTGRHAQLRAASTARRPRAISARPRASSSPSSAPSRSATSTPSTASATSAPTLDQCRTRRPRRRVRGRPGPRRLRPRGRRRCRRSSSRPARAPTAPASVQPPDTRSAPTATHDSGADDCVQPRRRRPHDTTPTTPTTEPTTPTTDPTTPTTDPTTPTTDPTTPTTAPPPPPTLVETDGGLSTDLNGDTVFTFYIANNGPVAVHPQATITLARGVILRNLPFWDCGYRPRMTVLNASA